MSRLRGARAGRVAAAAALVERLLLGALASVVVGHYLAGVIGTAIAGWRFTGFVRPEDLATVIAVTVIALLWLRVRVGRDLSRENLSRRAWMGIGVILLTIIWAIVTAARANAVDVGILAATPPPVEITGWLAVDRVLVYLAGLALTLTVLGGGDVLATRPASSRLRGCGRCGAPESLPSSSPSSLPRAAHSSSHCSSPPASRSSGSMRRSPGSPSISLRRDGLRNVLALALAAAAVAVVVPAAHAALADAEQMLHRASADGVLPHSLAALHARFGTPARAVDMTVTATMLVIVVSGGRVSWLARAYAMAIAATLLLKIAALVRHRRTRRDTTPFKVPVNLQLASVNCRSASW